MTMIMNVQNHILPTALATGLDLVRSNYQYRWNLDSKKSQPECAINSLFISEQMRKLHTKSGGFKYIRLKRAV